MTATRNPSAVADESPVARWPELSSGQVVLRPVRGSDYEALRQRELSVDLGPRWRLKGATPSPEAHAQGLWAGVLAQFLVVALERAQEPVAIVTAYQPDFQHQHAHLAVARLDGRRGDGSSVVLEGAALFVEYLFRCWSFRKLYLETLEYNLETFASGVGRLFHEEGRLREHEFAADRYWDKVVLAVYRDDWDDAGVIEMIRQRDGRRGAP